jgi:FtsZ-binding cell division protein ZapB
MGAKLAIVFFMLTLAMGGVGSWYYKQTQERIAVLHGNNAKLEVAVDTAESSIKLLQEEAVENAERTARLQSDLQIAEEYGDNLRKRLRQVDLVQDAIRDSDNLEERMNGATAKLWRELETSTGGDGSTPLPNWLRSKTRAGSEDSNTDTESISTDSKPAKTN